MSVNQIILILWRRLWLVVLGLVATVLGAAALVSIVPPRYEARATASVDFGRADPVTGAEANALAARGAVGSFMALIGSQKIAADVVRRLNLASDPQLTQAYLAAGVGGQLGINEWIAQTISKNVVAGQVDGTNVISITYRSTSPIEAALFANTFMASFEDAVIELKVSAAQQTASWLEPQLEKLRTDLEASRQKLTQFQRDAKLLAPGSGGESDTSPLLSTGSNLQTVKAELLAMQSQLAAIDSGQGEAQTSLLDSPVLAGLKNSLASVGADLGRARTELGSNNPKVQALLASQRSIQEQIKVELATIRLTSAAKMKALQDQIGTLQTNYSDQYGKMIDVQAQRDKLASMQREVGFRQELVDVALKNSASARMEGQLSFSNVSTLDNATPPSGPSFPKIPLIAALSVGAGLALGVIFALIAEALDRRIRVVSDLNFATEAPLLGVISRSRGRAIRRSKDKGFSLSLPAAQR